LGEAVSPGLDLGRIRQELRELELPDEVIRPHAEARSTGDQLKDWYAALDELRGKYIRDYISAMTQRHNL